MEHSIQTVKDRFNSGEPLEYVFFWGHHTKLGKMTKACFSQWFPADFVVDDVAYNCTEQYMMAEKARVFGDDDIRQKMLASNDPKEIKALGRQVKNFDAETWRRVSPDIVVKGIFINSDKIRSFASSFLTQAKRFLWKQVPTIQSGALECKSLKLALTILEIGKAQTFWASP